VSKLRDVTTEFRKKLPTLQWYLKFLTLLTDDQRKLHEFSDNYRQDVANIASNTQDQLKEWEQQRLAEELGQEES